MERKRILITVATLKRGGGAEKIASILGCELSEKNYEVHYLTFYEHEEQYDFKGKKTCLKEKNKQNSIAKISKLLMRANKIANYCIKKNINTCIGFMEEANFPLCLSKHFGNKSKIIISERINPTMQANKTYNLLIKKLYPKAEKVVALSKDVENTLKRDFKLSNTMTIHNMIPPSNTKQIKTKKTKKFRFITIGRLSEQKGQWHLLKALKKVAEKEENIELFILGEGSLKEEFKKLSGRLGIKQKVKFLGVKKDIYKYLNESDCFVFPSLWEGFGNVLVEALQTNTPIISTDCHSGPREILAPELNITEKITYPYYGTYGILTESFKREQNTAKRFEATTLNKQEEQLAEMMKEMIEKKTLRKKYTIGAKRADDFTPKNIIKQWEEVI